MVQFCIDYLKVRFNGIFILSSHGDIWSALGLNEGLFSRIAGRSGYRDGFELDEGLFVFYGGEFTRNSSGEETWLLEMKGKACRNFENRFPGSGFEESDRRWADFLRLLLLKGGVCTRIDIPTDDLSGSVPFAPLREKIARREYVSRMRRFSINDSLPPDIQSSCEVISSSNGGYTATLGSRESIQLCIYNKKAERESAGYAVNAGSWIRYEVRYYHSCAEQALPLVESAMREGRTAGFWLGCLSNIIRFVDKREGNLSRCVTWQPWADFVDDGLAEDIRTRARPDMTVRGNARWLDDDASKAVARVSLVHPEESDDVFAFILNSGASRLDEKDLMIVNAERVDLGLEPYGSVADAILEIASNSIMLKDVSDRVADLFGRDSVSFGEACFRKG